MPADRDALLEQLDLLVTWLECGDGERPELFGSRDEYEWLIRLTGFAMAVLTRHDTDADGCCEQCREPRDGWRVWLPRRRVPCHVVARANAFTRSGVEKVWWQALSLRGDEIRLRDVRAWLDATHDEHAATAPAKHSRVVADELFRPYVWGELPTERMQPDEIDTQELPRLLPKSD